MMGSLFCKKLLMLLILMVMLCFLQTACASLNADPKNLFQKASEAMEKQKYQEAFNIAKPLADSGDKDAENLIGVLYLKGWAVNTDYEKALYWFDRAASKGNLKSYFNIGYMCDKGLGVETNFEKAVYWYQKSAEGGYSQAQSILGAMYAVGDGVEQDYERAFQWYLKAAMQDEPEAQRRLGVMYAKSQGVNKDYSKSIEWFNKAAKNKNIGALQILIHAYERGTLDITINTSKAVELYFELDKVQLKGQFSHITNKYDDITIPGSTISPPGLRQLIRTAVLADDKKLCNPKLIDTIVDTVPQTVDPVIGFAEAGDWKETWVVDRCEKTDRFTVAFKNHSQFGLTYSLYRQENDGKKSTN